jgi:hypothetical protein
MPGGAPVAGLDAVRQDYAAMNHVFAQSGMRVTGGDGLAAVDPPAAEPFVDAGFDHDGNPATPSVNPTFGAFDFDDANGNDLHDAGERSEPFTDRNGNGGYDFAVDLSDGLDEFDTFGPLALVPSREERSLIDSLSDDDPATIEYFVVNTLDQGSRGEAFASDVPGFVANLRTANVIVARAASTGAGADFVNAAHEVGHVVLAPRGGHTPRGTVAGRVNFMVGGGTDLSDCVTCSKRMSTANVGDARAWR